MAPESTSSNHPIPLIHLAPPFWINLPSLQWHHPDCSPPIYCSTRWTLGLTCILLACTRRRQNDLSLILSSFDKPLLAYLGIGRKSSVTLGIIGLIFGQNMVRTKNCLIELRDVNSQRSISELSKIGTSPCLFHAQTLWAISVNLALPLRLRLC
jgi:hypothetical protein